MTDTIYALSSGAVPAGVAIIRVSGPAAGDILARLCGFLPRPRYASLVLFRVPDTADILDEGLALWFPAPASYTGEDLAELQIHGSRAVVQAFFAALSALGARLAEPGEFSRRAFQNNKLDLTAVEGIADLIAAETEMQRRQALGQARGRLAERAEAWRREIILLRAALEARLDFSDEADVPDEVPSGFSGRVQALANEMAAALSGSEGGERLREGFRVAILGRPNAGKSSLLNALAQRDVAIVTAEPGTTRDVLEVALDLAGYPVLLYDTAGLRDARSLAEREGVRRAAATARTADLVLWLEDCTLPPDEAPSFNVPVWRIASKTDLRPCTQTGVGLRASVSARSGAGISELLQHISGEAAQSIGPGGALITRQRQREALQEALAAIGDMSCTRDEIAADLLRTAGDAIARLTGRIDVEHVLDALFAEFCVGK